MKKLIMAAAIALAAGLAFASAAMAASATSSVNVRSGPGTGYTVVDTLYAGENVTVGECRSSGWCYITHSGPDGWVSSRYLSNTGSSSSSTSGPTISFSFSFGRGNGFSMGGGPRGSNQEVVCLVTFYRSSQVAGGADANVQNAQIMSRWQAEQIDRPNDRRAIYDYGTNQQTRDTCRYLDSVNN